MYGSLVGVRVRAHLPIPQDHAHTTARFLLSVAIVSLGAACSSSKPVADQCKSAERHPARTIQLTTPTTITVPLSVGAVVLIHSPEGRIPRVNNESGGQALVRVNSGLVYVCALKKGTARVVINGYRGHLLALNYVLEMSAR
jgi:hypothetical protein